MVIERVCFLLPLTNVSGKSGSGKSVGGKSVSGNNPTSQL